MIHRLLALLFVVIPAGCVTVRPVAAPVNFIPQENPQLVWVTANSGEVIPMARPVIRGDSLAGQWLGSAEPVSVPLGEVRAVHARQPDRTRTALLVASALAVTGFIVWRAASSSRSSGCVFDSGNNWWTCP